MVNKKKREQLGMPFGTASGKLRKSIIFWLVQETKRDMCFRCDTQIVDIDNLSIEHKEDWLDSSDPVELFFSLDNIAFSHLKCNISATDRKHGDRAMYNPGGCRCNKCVDANRNYARDHIRNKRNIPEEAYRV